MRPNRFLLTTMALLTAAQPLAAQAAAAEPEAAAPPAAAEEQADPAKEARLAALQQPQDELERSLWLQMDEYERDLKVSQQVIHDPALNEYVRGVLCNTVGEAECRNIRLYIMHTPHFNASMAPNGVMQVWSGLLLRTQNEAQLAAVLAHEYVHFENRHSVALFREAKSKSATATWLAFTGIGLIASIGLAGSLFKFSREQEREADLDGLAKMAAAGYDTREAALIWEQLRDEMDATAADRGRKSKKDKNGGLFATHPPTAERVAYLREESAANPGTPGASMADHYQLALAEHWPVFVDDQLKMNDFGASAFLVESLTKVNGSTPWLDYARAELFRRRAGDGDMDVAIEAYSAAIERGGKLPELWRGRGLARLKLGQLDDGQSDLKEYLDRRPDARDRGLISMMSGGME